MPKKKKAVEKEKPQRKRFIEFAREIGADQDKAALDRAFKKIAGSVAKQKTPEQT